MNRTQTDDAQGWDLLPQELVLPDTIVPPVAMSYEQAVVWVVKELGAP
jgi:hypothetical protein